MHLVIAQKLEQRFGKSFANENRPGAGTTIAAGATAKVRPPPIHQGAGRAVARAHIAEAAERG